MRIGQEGSRHRKAVKVWDKREFRDFDDSREIGTRNIKIALKRLRRWVREGLRTSWILPAPFALPLNTAISMCRRGRSGAMP